MRISPQTYQWGLEKTCHDTISKLLHNYVTQLIKNLLPAKGMGMNIQHQYLLLKRITRDY